MSISRLAMLLLMIAIFSETRAGIEEARLSKAVAGLPAVTSRYEKLVERAAAASGDAELVELGEALWHAARDDVQNGMLDDRALYWARIAVRDRLDGSGRDLAGFERASRGMSRIGADTFWGVDADASEGRVLLTGFDPFHLDVDTGQSNPSGLAALALDDTVVETARGRFRIQALVMPVRFRDFDQGLVEATLGPALATGNLDLLLTISMGRDAFDLERFPGRRRSAPTPDNENVLTGADVQSPLIPRLGDAVLEGPEFVEFSLPARAMSGVEGRWPVRDNRHVVTLEQGAMAPLSLEELGGLTAVSGSGGGYLSNEISYRALRLAGLLDASAAVGHLHTPRVSGYDEEAERDMMAQIGRILLAALESLPED